MARKATDRARSIAELLRKNEACGSGEIERLSALALSFGWPSVPSAENTAVTDTNGPPSARAVARQRAMKEQRTAREKSTHTRVHGCKSCPFYSVDGEIMQAYCVWGVMVDVDTSSNGRVHIPAPDGCPLREGDIVTSGRAIGEHRVSLVGRKTE